MTGAVQRLITPMMVRDALHCIPPDVDRDTWVRLAMAIKSELGSEGFAIWEVWSQQSADYKAADARDTWRSIKAGGRVKIGTLFALAKANGYQFPDAQGVQTSATPNAAAVEAAKRSAAARQRKRDAEEAEYRRRADQAARAAQVLWDEGSEAASGPYLQRKNVEAYGVRHLADGTLLVPMRDAAGELQNVQRIAPQKATDGAPEKRFLPGGRKSGLYHLVGSMEGAAALLVAEGYATVASLHAATGRPVAVAFDAGNLVHVVKALRALYPRVPVLVCGDDDRATEVRTGKNPGRDKAATAARAAVCEEAGAAAVFPEGLPSEGTDFNDLASHLGLEAVRGQVERAISALGQAPAATRRKSRQKGAAAQADCEAPGASVDEVSGDGRDRPTDTQVTPDADQQAASDEQRRGRDPFRVDERGVWFVARDNNGDDKPPMWLSDPVHVTAITRDESDNGYGYLVEFVNRDNNPRVWAAPSALFGGDAGEWAARLRDMGLRMATGAKARNLLGQYIDSRNPGERVTCTDRVGWHGSVYVLPSRCIGPADGKRFVFQTDTGMDDTFRRRGELATWRETIAARCEGNSRLVFSLSCAFAGPLVGVLGVQTGGFHLVGDSSLGKTTALLVAASVWGPPKFKQQWRTTDNGLEGVAVQHSDCLLILDEIGQMDGRVVGDCAYMLANEAEKIRGSRGLLTRKRRTWRLLFLSSGEKGLSAHMQEAGKKPNEGQMVRMPSIPADAGAGLGMFEVLHGVPEGDNAGKVFAESLTAAGAAAYGSAGASWIEWLASHMGGLGEAGAALMRRMENEWVPDRAHPQVWRVATRFALVGAAGELATAAGVTGWQAGEAERAARKCFDAWLRSRGHAGNGEEVAMVQHVRAFLEKNGEALFTFTHRAMDDHRANTPLRAGFKRMLDEDGNPLKLDAATDYVNRHSTPESAEQRYAQIEFLVFPEAFRRDVCKGFDPGAVADVLRKRGHLIHEKDRHTSKQRLPGMGKGPVPCFHIKPSIFADES
jgi:putative DNA primase/helicase